MSATPRSTWTASAELKAAISRKEADLAAIRRELTRQVAIVIRLLRGSDHFEAKSWEAFDLLATMVAVVKPDGHCLFVNSVLESVIGLSRKTPDPAQPV